MDTQNAAQGEMLTLETLFPTLVYHIDKPEFLNAVNEVAEELLVEARKKDTNELYPVIMSGSMFNDPRMNTFNTWTGQTAWNILDAQGYDMSSRVTRFTELWAQEHHKYSQMEQHIHGGGNQIIGFYFLECPEDCSNIVFYDPRAAKVQIDLPLKDQTNITASTFAINYKPRPGQFFFSNAWLPHSFTRHGSDKPMKFVHFNLDTYVQHFSIEQVASCPANVEII